MCSRKCRKYREDDPIVVRQGGHSDPLSDAIFQAEAEEEIESHLLMTADEAAKALDRWNKTRR